MAEWEGEKQKESAVHRAPMIGQIPQPRHSLRTDDHHSNDDDDGDDHDEPKGCSSAVQSRR